MIAATPLWQQWVFLVCVIAPALIVLIWPLLRWLWAADPEALVRDVIAVALVALLVFLLQWWVDDNRADRDNQIAERQNFTAQRLENQRFVRERASPHYQVRPFRELDLQDMNIAGLQLISADFSLANLTEAKLGGSDLRSCSNAPIECPYSNAPGTLKPFPVSLMAGANLCRATVAGTRFNGAWLIKANFTDVDLSQTDMSNAILYGADLRHAKLPTIPDLFRNVHHDSETRWPDGFEPPRQDQAFEGTIARAIFRALEALFLGNVPLPQCEPKGTAG